jgi:hypothetical protein
MIIEQPSILHSVAVGFPMDIPVRNISDWIMHSSFRLFLNDLAFMDRPLQYLRYQPRTGFYEQKVGVPLAPGDKLHMEFDHAYPFTPCKEFMITARLVIDVTFPNTTAPRVF